MADNSPSEPVDIVNLALTELKTDAIMVLAASDDKVAVLCNRHYDIERKALLRSHIWNFAKTEASLSIASSATSFSFSDIYPLPELYLRLVSVGDVLVWEKKTDYDIRSVEIDEVFTRCILRENDGAATLDIIYIRNVISVSEFDPLFIKLLKFKVALAIAPGLTLKPTIKISIENNLANAMLEARSIDGMERPPVRIQNSKFLNARRNALRQKPIVTTTFES